MTDIAQERTLVFEKIVPARINEVWEAWTTEEGAKTFFAPECKIDLQPGGCYEMYFDTEAVQGKRGGEGCKILAVVKPNFLSFTWNFPPDIQELRNSCQSTHITVNLIEQIPGVTLVRLTQDGWGTGKDWDKGMTYFTRAWGEVVLPRLYRRFTEGPISW